MIKISISTKLALFISLIVSISVAMVAMFTYIRSENQLLESIGIELRSIVQSTAPLINAEMHDNFSFDSDDVLDQTSDFKQLQRQLIKVRDSNKMPHGSGLSPLYTLRKTWEFDENNQLEFVIMTDVNRQEKFYSGALYPVRNFQKKALQGDVVVTEIYRDDEGSWITAAAPIINEDNEIVAILQADRRVDFVYQQIWDLKLLYIEAGISSLILGVFLVMIFAWWSSKPIKELTHAVSQFGTGNLKYRINKIRGDEFGYLYKNFNKMAENIASTEKKLIKANFHSEQARMHAEADSNVKSEFLAVMSHEIRTPMNSILGMIQILKETELESSQRNYINTIYRSGNALLVILNDILDFSKFEEGNLSLDKTDFDLEHSCLDIMVLLKPKADKAGVKFYMHIAPECPKWVHGDAVRTRKILLNLISNSIKFTTSGYIYLDIDFRMIDDNKFDLLVSIYDSGIGISSENQNAIFNMFSQTDSSMSRKYSGIGLGLAISKNLLDLMEGELGVSSEVGAGSTFWFSLPLIRGENFSNKEMIEKVVDVDILFLETDIFYIEIMIEKFKYLDIKFTIANELEKVKNFFGKNMLTNKLVIVNAENLTEDIIQSIEYIKTNKSLLGTPLLLISSANTYDDVKDMFIDTVSIVSSYNITLHQLASEISYSKFSFKTREKIKTTLLEKKKLNILLVEDDVSNQLVAKAMLNDIGHDVNIVLAIDGQDALDKWQEQEDNFFNFILMDCQMPNINGYEATKNIRTTNGGKKVPIIALTANSSDEEKQKCKNSGMDDFYSKPYKKEIFKTIVSKWG